MKNKNVPNIRGHVAQMAVSVQSEFDNTKKKSKMKSWKPLK